MKLSKSELKHLELELKNLEEIELPKRREMMRLAVEEGDGQHDNPLWQDSELKMQRVLDRIADLKEIIRTAEIAEKNSIEIGIGSVVTLASEDKKERVFIIVNDENVNSREGKISLNSPIGKMLEGKNKNDSVTINTKTFTITSIS